MENDQLDANQKALLIAYKSYLSNKEIFNEMEELFKNSNTATKIELYKRTVDMEAKVADYASLRTGNQFVDNAVLFLQKQFDGAKNRVYKLTAEAVANIDDPDFLNGIG